MWSEVLVCGTCFSLHGTLGQEIFLFLEEDMSDLKVSLNFIGELVVECKTLKSQPESPECS